MGNGEEEIVVGIPRDSGGYCIIDEFCFCTNKIDAGSGSLGVDKLAQRRVTGNGFEFFELGIESEEHKPFLSPQLPDTVAHCSGTHQTRNQDIGVEYHPQRWPLRTALTASTAICSASALLSASPSGVNC